MWFGGACGEGGLTAGLGAVKPWRPGSFLICVCFEVLGGGGEGGGDSRQGMYKAELQLKVPCTAVADKA